MTAINKTFGNTHAVADVDFTLAAQQQLVLLGPSGCGKTTLLRMIAGLVKPDSGSITVDGQVLSDPGSFVPPEKRRIGMVFQDWALFPHMTVGKNVAYGLTRSDISAGRVEETLELLHMLPLAERKPHQLSAGQAQRVALARALAPRPRLLLFDEPFSSLDAELRVSVRREVSDLMRQVHMTAVYVTHDQEEAFVLGDQVAVMNAGRVVQVGRPADIYKAPVSEWVAGFVGDANVFAAVGTGHLATTELGEIALVHPAVGPCRVLARPEHLLLRADPAGVGRVTAVEFRGHDTSYRVAVGAHEFHARAVSVPSFAIDDRVALTYVGPAAVTFLD